MEKIYHYHISKRIIYTTAIYALVFIGTTVVLAFAFDGGYISAWFISLILALLALMTLSTPRRIVVDEEGIEIQCIAKDITLAYEDITNVQRVDNLKMASSLPLLGAVGFLGHYGKFLNLRTMELVYIYASEWGNFIEITDAEENKYYIACEGSEALLSDIEKALQRNTTKESN